ncbi:MAG: hypothetical protein U1D55_11780 [Phycisphaerae bacterium]
MRNRLVSASALLTSLVLPAIAFAGDQVLQNGSAEIALVDPRDANSWTFFGGTTIERSTEANFTSGGVAALKIFGGSTTVGAYQDVTVAPGNTVAISTKCFTKSTDQIGGDATANLKLEFHDAGDNVVGTPVEIVVLPSGATPDVWTNGSISAQVAPAGTAKARFTCAFVYTNSSSGAAFWDACNMSVNGSGTNALTNPDFEIAGGATLTPSGYNTFGTVAIATNVPAFHGTNSVKISTGPTQGTFCGIYRDPADAVSGDRILMRGWIWNPSVNGLSAQAAAAIKLEFQTPGGGTLPPAEENLVFGNGATLDTWTLVTYTTTVPASPVSAAKVVMISNDTSATNGPVFVDHAFAERSSAPGVNQLLNADFTDGPGGPNGLTNWTEFRSTPCSARKALVNFNYPSGNGNVLQISGTCIAGVYQSITVTPGETLTISAYFRSNSTQPYNDPTSNAGVKVEWSAGSVPAQIDIGAAGQNNTVLSGAPTDTWIPVTIDYTMPPGSGARLRGTAIVGLYNATSAEVYFDGLEMVIVNHFNGADVDNDNDEDMVDFAWLQRNFRGNGVTAPNGLGPPGFLGVVYDQDRDNDVDGADWDYFRPRMTAPN